MVERMLETMRHRGPDGLRASSDGRCALGHAMLHTTPESLSEVLPHGEDDLTITADARIDNRAELIAELGLESSVADSEVILSAYARWGEACPEHLLGDFAFAIHDRANDRLFVARDHLGCRPLYLADVNDGVAFATEPKALLAHPDVSHDLDEQRIADFIVGLNEDPHITIYRHIRRLPAAHAAIVDASGTRQWRYYELKPAELPVMDDAGYASRFREIFEEAVRCRVRSAFPVGSQLSGGLDSTYVTCVARDLLQETGTPLHSFSLIFDVVPSCDEREFIDPVVEQGGFTPHYVGGDTIGPLANVASVYETLDDGLVGGTQHMVWALLQSAREAGVRIVLDGIDGDQVVSHGHLYLKELAKAGEWDELARQFTHLVDRYSQAGHRQDFEDTFVSHSKLFSQYALPVLDELARGSTRRAYARQLRAARRAFTFSVRAVLRRHARWLLKSRKAGAPAPDPFEGLSIEWLNQDFRARSGIDDRARHFVTHRLDFDSVRSLQRSLLSSQRLTSALETTNHFAAAHGLDVAHPFMDLRLVEYCLGLPPDQSLDSGWTRIVMRRAMKGIVPDSVTERIGKAQMSPAFDHGLFNLDYALFKSTLDSPEGLLEYVDAGRLSGQLGSIETSEESTRGRLVKLATLALWLDGLPAKHARLRDSNKQMPVS
jgi:asparagine synthase (glutamine-hydrolysing)